MKKLLLIAFILFSLPISCFGAEAENSTISQITKPTIRIFNPLTGEIKKEFLAFSEESKALGANVSVGDLNSDGYLEIIVSTNSNEKPLVRIFNYQGIFLNEFLAYEQEYTNGLKAISTVYNGLPAIITAPNEKHSPLIRIFDLKGNLLFEFLAFEENQKGGVNIASADLDNDGKAEILAAPGKGMNSLIKIFDQKGALIKGFEVFEKTYTNGITITASDLNNDKLPEIIVGPAFNHNPEIKIFDYNGLLLSTFFAYHPGFDGGVNISNGDPDNNGQNDLISGPGFSGGSHVRFLDRQGQIIINHKFFAFSDFKGGLSITSGDLDKDNKSDLIVATQNISLLNKYQAYKIIEVNLAKQHLYVYEKGQLQKDFIISTGKNKFPTPKGNFQILWKVLKTTMARNYGPDNPDNYNLKNVPHVMYFYRDYAIHGAYWHWKFGTRVSHGCINLKLPDAKWLYEWADVRTPVNIYSSLN